jgi:hypothetical protein
MSKQVFAETDREFDIHITSDYKYLPAQIFDLSGPGSLARLNDHALYNRSFGADRLLHDHGFLQDFGHRVIVNHATANSDASLPTDAYLTRTTSFCSDHIIESVTAPSGLSFSVPVSESMAGYCIVATH